MTLSTEEIARTLALTEISGIADGRAKELVSDFGSAEAVLAASPSELEEYHYINDEAIEHIENIDADVADWAARLESCREEGIKLISVFDDRYPDRLKQVSGPLLLYAKGDTELLTETDAIGFTGTREASEDAVTWTRNTATRLAEEGRTIISGGAEGIDSAAHLGALVRTGKTIVVLGTGINVPYPPENETLFERVVDEGGLLLAQRPPDASPSRAGFLNRNVTLTGLSDAVTVVATDGSGGTMSTYSDAKSQERQVFCPDPELELEPIKGIEKISNEVAIPVRRAEEILAYQDNRESDMTSDPEEIPSTKGQSSIDDFS